jgi:hypothetical protein
MRPEGLGKLKKLIRLLSLEPHDLPSCSIVLQPLHYRVRERITVNINYTSRYAGEIMLYCVVWSLYSDLISILN